MAEIELVRLSERWGRFVAVEGIDLRIGDGEFLVLLGPSGCGKTTTMRMIAGLEVVHPPADHHERVMRAARTVELTELLDREPAALSGGQRQRVALARAIVRKPKVFLMDEPLSNLDAKLRVSTRAQIKNLHHELRTTTIYVTHDQIEAMTLADRVVVMSKGEVQQVGTPLEIYDRPANTFVAGFIGNPAMNLIPGEPRAFTFHAANAAIPGFSGVPDGPVTLGFRAEDARVRATVEAMLAEIDRLLAILPTAETAGASWRDHGEVVLCDSYEEMLEVANAMAFEHVQVVTGRDAWFQEHLHSYGALFPGPRTNVANGDKVIGTNHTLPTRRAGRYTGGLWVGKFLETHTYQKITSDEAASLIGRYGSRLCMLEGFVGHAEQCNLRVRRYGRRDVPYGEAAE